VVRRPPFLPSAVATVVVEASTAEVGSTLAEVEATLLMVADTTAAITAEAMVGTEVTAGTEAMAGGAAIGATLVTDTDGDLVSALAGDPIGLHTRMPTGMARGGALLTIIIRALILIILRLAARTLIPIPTTAAALVPRKILDGTVTTIPRQNHRAFPHGRTLLTLPL
jgi:hypothetical protein